LKCPNKCLHVEKANQQTGNFRVKGVKGLEAKAKANHGRAHTPKNKSNKKEIPKPKPSSHRDILILPFGPTHNVHGQKREQRQKSKPHAERSLRPQGRSLPAEEASSALHIPVNFPIRLLLLHLTFRLYQWLTPLPER